MKRVRSIAIMALLSCLHAPHAARAQGTKRHSLVMIDIGRDPRPITPINPAQDQQTDSLSRLPEDLYQEIAQFLDPESLQTLGHTSKAHMKHVAVVVMPRALFIWHHSLPYFKGLTSRGFDITQIRHLGLRSYYQRDGWGLPNCFQLKTLRIDTGFFDNHLAFFSQLTHLIRLKLSSNGIRDTGLSALSPLTNLTFLVLANNKITGTGLSALSPLTNLIKLDLGDNQITAQGQKTLQTHLPNVHLI